MHIEIERLPGRIMADEDFRVKAARSWEKAGF